MQIGDWPSVARIYKEGLATGFASFETDVPDFDTWSAKKLNFCRLVITNNEEILGWAALSPNSTRMVYKGVAEVSIYLSKKAQGKGLAQLLFKALITASEKNGIWSLQSSIFPENKSSIRLHEKMGFRYLGKRERIAKTLEGVWKDNLLYERRSDTVGTA